MATHSIPAPSTGWSSHALARAKTDPVYGAFVLLWLGFIAIPLIMGLDKFFNVLTNWENYLAPWIENLSPFSAQGTMMAIGVVEVIAAIAMIVRPRYAAWIVSLWLAGIVINLLTYSGFYDVALRDFGLMVAAIALGLLARGYTTPGFRKTHK